VPVFGGLPSGAMLRVVGFDRIALADAAGRAEFRDLLPGWYDVEIASPLEDSLRVPGTKRRMIVRADVVSVVQARVRSDETARENACPDQRSLPILGGELFSGVTPLAGATLTLLPTRPLTGNDLLLTTQDRTDSRGRFRLCGLRLGETFVVKIKTADGAVEERRLRLDAMPAGRLHWMTIVLPP
jgi:hypothetical protein